MADPPVWTLAEAATVLADPGAVEELGHPAGPGVVAVDLRGASPARWPAGAGPALRRLPCVTVALVAGPEPPGGDGRGAFDVVLAPVPVDGAGLPRDPEGGLAEVAAAVADQPVAARVLVGVLRASEHLDVSDALVVESLGYSTLQSGPAFAAWRRARPRRDRPAGTGPAALVTRDGPVLTVVLNRPEVHNAYSAAMRDALVEALTVAALDPTVTEVHLRGAGPTFSSGGDLDEFGSLPDPATGHAVRVARSAALLVAGLEARVVVHAAGACRGAGAELAAFADEVRVAPGTTFGLPELSLGLIPGAGGTVSLPRRIGRQRTAWLGLTGRALDAATAIEWGLADAWDPGPG